MRHIATTATIALLGFATLAPAAADEPRTFECIDGATAVLKGDTVTVTGGIRDGAVLKPGYWWFHDDTEAFIGFLDADRQEPGVIDCERAK